MASKNKTSSDTGASDELKSIKESLFLDRLLGNSDMLGWAKRLSAVALFKYLQAGGAARLLGMGFYHTHIPSRMAEMATKLPELRPIQFMQSKTEAYWLLQSEWKPRPSQHGILTLPSGAKALFIAPPHGSNNVLMASLRGIWCRREHRDELRSYIANLMTTFGDRPLRIREASVEIFPSGSSGIRWVRRGHGEDNSDLDAIPLASSVRAALEDHIEFLQSCWTSDDLDRRSMSSNILFYGEAGTGKTSAAYAVARALSGTVTLFPTGHARDQFWDVVERIGVYDTVLVDEADTHVMFRPVEDAAVSNADVRQQRQSDVSDVLAYMTGPRAPTATTTIVITNHREAIDKRIVREGRVRAEVHFTPVDAEGLRHYLRVKYGKIIPAHVSMREDLTTTQIKAMEERCNGLEDFITKLTTPSE